MDTRSGSDGLPVVSCSGVTSRLNRLPHIVGECSSGRSLHAGVGAILANMQNETEALSKNVVERVRTALDNLAALDMFTE